MIVLMQDIAIVHSPRISQSQFLFCQHWALKSGIATCLRLERSTGVLSLWARLDSATAAIHIDASRVVPVNPTTDFRVFRFTAKILTTLKILETKAHKRPTHPGAIPLFLIPPRHSKHRLCVISCLLVGIGGLMGCRGRARDDIYIETMAAEIRDLEDQCYEYDYEYRRLEQEYADMARRMANAEKQLETPPQSGNRGNNRQPSVLDRIGSGNASPAPSGFAPPSSDAATEGNSINSLPAPGSRRGPAGDDDPTGDFDDLGDVPLDALEPPTIEFGSPAAPPVSVLQTMTPGVAPENDLELNLSRIEIPAATAGHQKPVDDDASLASSGNEFLASGKIQTSRLVPAKPRVTDRRIVELGFHPALSRSVDLDGAPGDDGVILVVQPKNASGQIVDEYAKLTILILDPALPETRARIGFREYTPDEVRVKMKPLGAQQGIHLQLPWNGPNPRADRVIVFAKYTFSNEQEVIGSREIMLTNNASFKTVWTPRLPGDGRPATSFAGRDTGRASPRASLPLRTPPPNDSVVRPASGIRPAAAPTPDPRPSEPFSESL